MYIFVSITRGDTRGMPQSLYLQEKHYFFRKCVESLNYLSYVWNFKDFFNEKIDRKDNLTSKG